MVDEKNLEIIEFSKLDKEFSTEEALKILDEVERLGRELEVGGQTSYQNKFFVLNPVEFPQGTSGKSRQAIFEGAVRVDQLKGSLADLYKTEGEIKVCQARILRAQRKMRNDDEADQLEGEGELIIAETELKQKERALEGIRSKAKHMLRCTFDFYGEFVKNEVDCEKLGFNVHDWNKLEVEDHYWRSVNDMKVAKAASYAALGMNQQTGDSLPFQHNLNIGRVLEVRDSVMKSLAPPQNTPPGSGETLEKDPRLDLPE